MLRYILQRVGHSIFVLLGVTLITFLLLHQIPGGAARGALGSKATPGAIALFNQQNGYNLPLVEQYIRLIDNLVHLRFGYSYKLNETVGFAIAQRLPKTLLLMGLSTALALIVTVPLAVLQVSRRNKLSDHFLTGVFFVLYAMPPFLLGTLLILYFAIDLKVFGFEAPQSTSVLGILSQPRNWLLPVVTLAAITVASFSRYLRSSLMEALTQEYIRTAKAKGASSRRVLYAHALRNAALPLITLVGLSIPVLIGGAVVTEAVFNYPGMGLLTYNAIATTDVPLLIGVTLVFTAGTIVGSLLADVLYAVVDPRIRYG
jgi:peptide/nickel transport system permease protein